MQKLNVTRLGWMAYGLAAAVIVLDQVSKTAMLGQFVRHCPDFIPHLTPGNPDCRIHLSPVFDLTMVWNRGMSFGLLRGEGGFGRWFLTLLAIGVSLALAWWARRADKALFAWASGLLMGGALGNVFDRFRFGAVVDFLDFSGIGFKWVFNVADSAITVGAALLLVEAFLPSLQQMLASRRDRVN